MIYTLIGSRETPEDVLNIMRQFAYKAASKGYIGRSGGADGADTCLENGVIGYVTNECLPLSKINNLMEVYLPWKDFNGRNSGDYGYYTLPFMDNRLEAENIAKELHPKWILDIKIESGMIPKPKNWTPMRQGAKKLHTRNIYQVLGKDLNTPSKFIVCYGIPAKGSVIPKGGTRTACVLGQQHGVEIFNLYLPDHRKRVEEWVK